MLGLLGDLMEMRDNLIGYCFMSRCDGVVPVECISRAYAKRRMVGIERGLLDLARLVRGGGASSFRVIVLSISLVKLGT